MNTVEHSRCSAANDLRVLSANVHVSSRRVDELLRLVDRTNPDLVLLMETDAWWHEHLQGLRERYPYLVEQLEQGPQRKPIPMVIRFSLGFPQEYRRRMGASGRRHNVPQVIAANC